MANFTAGTSFTDGVTNDVTAAKLNALVADAVPTSSLALASTSGTISNFTSSTATLLGAITGSTNVINIGSGQIYKAASGNCGIGTTSPATKLDVYGDGSFQSIEVGRAGQTGNRNAIIDFTGDETYPDYGFRIIRQSTGANADTYLTNRGTGNVIVESAEAGQVLIRTNSTSRFIVDANGNCGIGTTSPSAKLQVASGDIVISDNRGIGAGGGAQVIYNGTSQFLRFDTAATQRLLIDSTGNVTIAGLAGSGSRAVNASAAGLLSAASDASLKEEVVGAHIAGLNEILQIHPKMYRWKDDIANRGENASIELGFIANDVAPIIPSAAPLGNDGLYGFYDRSITAALVKSVQELKAENNSLKARIEALEAK